MKNLILFVALCVASNSSAEPLGEISSFDAWKALFRTPSALGFDQIVTPGDIVVPDYGSVPKPKHISAPPQFRVVISAPVLYNAPVFRFPPPNYRPSAEEDGMLVYKNAGPRFQKFLEEIKGPATIQIAVAKYVFYPPTDPKLSGTAAISIDGKTDLRIYGETNDQNHRPLFIAENPYGDFIRITHSQRVTVGGFDLDYNYGKKVRGRIPARVGWLFKPGISCGSGFIAAKIDSGEESYVTTIATFYSKDYEGNTSGLGTFINPVTNFFRWVGVKDKRYPDRPPFQRVKTAEATEACKGIKGNPHYFTSPLLTNTRNTIPKGEPVVLIHDRYGLDETTGSHCPMGIAISAHGPDTSNIRVNGVRLFSYPNMGFYFKGVTGVELKNNVIRALYEKGSEHSGRADGAHFAGCTGVRVVGNKFSDQADDGLNIRSNDFQVADFNPEAPLDDPNSPDLFLDFTGETKLLDTGDKLALLTTQNQPLFIVEVEKKFDKTTREIENRELEVIPVKVKWGTLTGNIRTELHSAMVAGRAGTQRFANAFALNRMSSSYVIEDNVFARSAARGMVLQAPNGLVRNNTISDVGSTGILATAENAAYVDGPGPINVILTQNRVERSGFYQSLDNIRNAGIGIGVTDDLGGPYPADYPKWRINFPIIHNVFLQGNSIDQSGQAGLYISRSAGVEVSSAEVIGQTNLSAKIDDSDQENYGYSFSTPDRQDVAIRRSFYWFVGDEDEYNLPKPTAVKVNNLAPFQNRKNPLDVNRDGKTSIIDYMLIVNDLNLHGIRKLKPTDELSADLDVNGDNLVSPIDCLLIANKLNGINVQVPVKALLGFSDHSRQKNRFRIEYATNSQGPWQFFVVQAQPGVSRYIVQTPELPSGQPFYFRVMAVGGKAHSVFSDVFNWNLP